MCYGLRSVEPLKGLCMPGIAKQLLHWQVDLGSPQGGISVLMRQGSVECRLDPSPPLAGVLPFDSASANDYLFGEGPNPTSIFL